TFVIFANAMSPDKIYAASGTWKLNSSGWWYELSDGSYYQSSWAQIDGSWYYFDDKGYMDSLEFRDGYWLNADGSWNTAYYGGTWKANSKGFWYQDASGWYPSSSWLWIDGNCYYFDQDGYLIMNDWIDGFYVGPSGAWIEDYPLPEDKDSDSESSKKEETDKDTDIASDTDAKKESDQKTEEDSESADEVEINPALIKSATFYYLNSESGEWVEQEKWEYAYENSYPVSKTKTYPGDDSSEKTTFEYKFEGKLPTSMTIYDNGVKTYTSQYKNGLLYVYSQYFEDGISTRHQIYSYENNDPYLTAVLHSSHVADYDPAQPCYNTEEIDSILVTTENGLLKQTINNGLYTNWLDGEDRDWERFNGTYIVNYDSMGIVNTTVSKFANGQEPIDMAFDVTVADGRVKEVVKNNVFVNGTQEKARKIVFEYTDQEIDKARYSQMINAHLMEAGNNFYVYNWY
ncbi:MAG: hypothetical protein K6E10_05220, partial [Eubacterium sp.]|nr:hypothetical protein [Eubacterium sp.]